MIARWMRAIRSFSFSDIPGPVFVKEVHVIGRRAATYWTRGLFTLGLLLMLLIIFAAQATQLADATPANRLQQLQTIAPVVAICIFWFEFILLALAAAAMCGGAICDERRKGTLGALLTTPLFIWQIVLGKVAGGAAQLIILALIGAPMLLAVRVFGGLTAGAVLASLSLIVSTLLLVCFTTIYCSVYAKRAATAMLGGLALAGIIEFAPAVIFAILKLRMGKINPLFIFDVSPPFALGQVCAEMMGVNTAGMGFSSWGWLTASAYAMGWALFFFLLTTVSLRGVMMREYAGSAAVVTPKAITKAAAMAAKRSRIVGDYPVLWREMQQTSFKSWKVMLFALLVAAGLLTYLYIEIGVGDMETHIVIAAITMGIILIVSTIATATSMAGERESRTIDVLLTTPMSAQEIVIGKFAGAIRRQWFVPALLGLNLLCAGVLTQVLSWTVLIHIAMAVLPAMALLGATGLWLSIVCKKTSTAAALNFLLALTVWLGIPLVVMVISELVFRVRNSDDFFSVWSIANPIGQVVISVMGSSFSYIANHNERPYDVYGLFSLSKVGYTGLMLAYVGGYAFATWVVLRAAARALAVRSGRNG